MTDPGVGLAEAIGAIREELIAARDEGQGKALSFTVGRVSVELGGELRSTAGAGGGVKFWVVNVDAKGERSSAATHRISIELLPTGPGGVSFTVHDSTTDGPAER